MTIADLIAKMDTAAIFVDGDDCVGSNLWQELKAALTPPPVQDNAGAHLKWVVAKNGGVEAVAGSVTYRAASLSSDYAILEIGGKRTDDDFPSVSAAQRAAEAHHGAQTRAPAAPMSADRHHPLCSVQKGGSCDYDCPRDYTPPQNIVGGWKPQRWHGPDIEARGRDDTHEEAMKTIFDAAGVVTMSYEEVAIGYARARGFIRDDADMMCGPLTGDSHD